MQIKLKKDWRAFGEIQKAGKHINIIDKNILKFLKDNNYIKNTRKNKIKDDINIIIENK